MIKLDKPNKLFRERARQLRKNSTLSEVLLWNQLKNKQFMKLDFDRQKVINNKYIADLFCAEHNIIIEIDGCSHDNRYKYDKIRHNYLIKLGFVVIHVDDLDIKTRNECSIRTYFKYYNHYPGAFAPPLRQRRGISAPRK